MSDDKTFGDLTRSDVPSWKSYVTSSSGALTLDMLNRACDAITAHQHAPTVITTSVAVVEGAGRCIGWPYLDAHFEELAQGAAHSIFGNIALDVRQAVTPMAAGLCVLGGEWPFHVAEWSKPQTIWN